MKTIIGLGNTGSKHEGNRHNIGFMVLDVLAQKEEIHFNERKLLSAQAVPLGEELLLVKPDTFMNNSGISAKGVVKNYDTDIVVIYDDIDIPLGEVRCSFARGAGGHNGVQSIIDHLGTKDFFRIRVGVRPVHPELQDKILPPDGFQNFLLTNFAPFEQKQKEQGIAKAIAIIEALKTETFENVMNQFN